jgi:acyl-CoA carboxylase epsilon subunit
VSAESEGTVTDESTSHDTEVHEPVLKVLSGNPTDDDLAALVAVLAGASGGGQVDGSSQPRDMWGHPVDKLRYAIFSWQRVTQVERTHIRR